MKKVFIAALLFVYTSTCFGQAFPIYRSTPTAHTCTSGQPCSPLTDVNGRQVMSIDSGTQTSSATGLLKLEDSPSASADAGVGVLGVINPNFDAKAAIGDYTFPALDTAGVTFVQIDQLSQQSTARGLLKREDDAAASGDAGVGILGKILAIPVSQANDGDYGLPLMNDLNAWYVDTIRRNTVTHTQPSVTTATSFTCLAANTARRYAMIQNNSAANIMINLNNGTLTGVAPTSTNLGIVLTPGSNYETPPNFSPTSAITCYQTSGGTINTISVMEGA